MDAFLYFGFSINDSLTAATSQYVVEQRIINDAKITVLLLSYPFYL